MEKRYKIFRYIAYSIEILLLFVLQTTPNLFPQIGGSKPVLLIPAALTIAFFEEEIPALFFGLACGVILDLSVSNNIGYFAFILTLVGFIVSQIFRDYMVVSFSNSLAFSAIFITLVIIAYFLVFYLFSGKPEPGFYFVNHYISRIIYTICFAPALYGLNKFLYRSLK